MGGGGSPQAPPQRVDGQEGYPEGPSQTDLFGSGGKKGMDSDGKGLGMGAKLQPAGSYNTKCAGYFRKSLQMI